MSNKDLGTIIYKIPHVQGADKPYKLPQAITPSAEASTPNNQGEEVKKTDQAEVEKEGEHEHAIPENTKSPKPTPDHHRP